MPEEPAGAGGDLTSRPPLPPHLSCEVLVIGGGPSGMAAAYWLAAAGRDVIVVEKKHYPRVKTCGDGLTPRSVRQLEEMGLGDELSAHHRYTGLRALAFGKELELPWPKHPRLPSYGYVITRAELDALVAERARKAGATVYEGAEAVAPLQSPVTESRSVAGSKPGSPGSVPEWLGGSRSGEKTRAVHFTRSAEGQVAGGAIVTDHDGGGSCHIAARYVIVADGSNSRYGRALGTARERSYPLGMALRGYYRSPRHTETMIESHLDIRDSTGNVVPGYGWIFPLGDGRVNVGIGLLSTDRRWKGVNTSQLLETFLTWAPDSWGLSPATSCGPPTGGKLAMGLSVGPRVGADYLVVGDAAGAINPFNGEGIAYGYETGRLAAQLLDQALRSGGRGDLAAYEEMLQESYGLYYAVARGFVQILGRPQLMRLLVSKSMYSRTLMEWVLAIMANMLREDELGPAEAAYRAVAVLARRAGLAGVL
jgi:flavin-dependent dehydrogenase